MSSTSLKTFARRVERKHHRMACREKETQTSKTILQLAKQELENPVQNSVQNNDTSHHHFQRKSDIFFSTMDLPEQEVKKKGLSLTRLFLSKHTEDPAMTQPSYGNFQVASTVDHKELANPLDENTVEEVFKVPQWSRFTIKEIRVKSIDAANNLLIQDYKKTSSTGSVPESIDIYEDPLESVKSQVSSARRGRSVSPQTGRSVGAVTSAEHATVKFKDYFYLLINNAKSKDWSISIKALVEIAEQANSFDPICLFSHMTEINQKLIEFLKSPRSQVCRTACQISGKFFESIKDTRRPEFDDIVELLLMKTADSNKFIRKDANLALDSMIMNISHIHTIRAISQKGPMHKNDLVRISTARLYVCIVGIAGINVIMAHTGNEFSRTKIFTNMVHFVKDKNLRTREYGIRLYKLLSDHPNFEFYLKKIVDKNHISELRRTAKKI